MGSVTRDQSPPHAASRSSQWLLWGGVLAGPIYVVVGVIESFTRQGYDPLKYDLSILANGDWGWIHSSLLVGSGLLALAGAFGIRASLAGGRAGTWGPILVGVYGLGLVAAGFMTADPARGFPPGTPVDYNTVSWHGLGHLISGAIGFVGLIAACFVFAGRYVGLGERGLAAYSVVTGVYYVAAFVGIVVGSGNQGTPAAAILAFDLAVIVGWAWLCVISARLLAAGASEQSSSTSTRR